jgi:acyl-CoA synthetase (NDP forming)
VTRADLGALFAPTSIAVVGASPTEGKAGNALMRSLARFDGPVHPVHRTASEVMGRRAYPSVDSIPHPVDLALLAVPAEAVPAAVGDCAAAGVGGVVVHAGGFAEAGSRGAGLQRAAAEAAAGAGVRLLGPNTSGFIAPGRGLCATFVTSTAQLRAGPLAIVAQSGGVNHALAFGAQADGLGLHLGVGLGNAADVGFADVLGHLSEDPKVGVVAMAIEAVADGRELVGAVARVTHRVPVVALVLGRADVAEFARSHTGALTGSRRVTRAALRAAGAVVVDDTTALLDAARALAARRLPPKADSGVAVVTAQAGPGLLLADALAVEGVSLPPLDERTRRRIGDLLGDLTFQRNPVDTGRPTQTLPDVLRAVAASDGVDALAVYLLDEPDAVDPRTLLAGHDGRPVVLGTAGPAGDVAAVRDALASSGIAVMEAPERAAAAVAARVRDARARAGASRRRPEVTVPPDLVAGDGPWDEARAKELVGRVGIATPSRAVAGTHEEALAAVTAIAGPFVLKLLHPELTHKSEHGAVRLGLRGEDEARQALLELDAIGVPPPVRYLVEAMAPAGPELLLGAVRDCSFGPVVTLGVGGVGAEAERDVATRLAPLSVEEAATMLGELRAAALFRGHREAPAVEESELAQAIANLAALLCARDDVAEIEINPLRVTRDGLMALDALVVARS